MDALLFLLIRRIKNRIMYLFRSPRQLIFSLTAAALFILTLFAGNLTRAGSAGYRSKDELFAIVTAIYAAVFLLSAYNGFLKGAAIFSVADVQLVFVSPESKKNAMAYGLIQQMGVSLSLGLSVLFQYSWMRAVYGTTFDQLLLILAGFAASLFIGQLTAALIYLHTCSDAALKRIYKLVLIAACSLPAIFEFIRRLACAKETAASALSSVAARAELFFVPGWISSAVEGICRGKPYGLPLTLSLMYAAAAAVVLMKSGKDYYEDVMKAAESEFKSVAARREGKFADSGDSRFRLGRTGLSKGRGANTLYYKHKLESRRTKVFILDTMTLIFAGIDLAAAVLLRSLGLTAVFILATYLQLFTVALGRWVRELVLPYIYLLSEPPFKKLLHCLREPAKKICVEAAVLLAPISLLYGLTLPEAAALVLARISFGFLFTSACILTERFFSGITVKAIALAVYFLCAVFLTVPGLFAGGAALLLSISLLPPSSLFLYTIIVCNFIVSLIVLFLSRNILEYAEINQR